MAEFVSSRVAKLSGVKRTSQDQGYESPHFEDQYGVDLGRMLGALLRRKWLILGIMLLFAAVFYILTLAQPKMYFSSATVMLDPREQQVVSTQDQVVSDLKLNNPIVESEVALLRSQGLLRSVVEEIGIDRFDALDPALAEPSFFSLVLAAGKNQISAGLERVRPSVSAESSESASELISSEQRRMSRILSALRKGVSVRRLGESYVIEVGVLTVDAELSARVANTLASNYMRSQLADRQRVAENATKWLADQVEDLREQLAVAETSVEEFKRQQLDNAGSSEEVLSQRLGELNQQISIARSERATEEARLQRIEDLLAQRGALAAAETQESSYLSSLRERREILAAEDARLAVSFGVNHPERRLIASELAGIETAIENEIANIADSYRNEIDVLQKREAALQADVDALEQQLSNIAGESLRLRQLEREADAVRNSYEEVLGRLGETRAQIEIQRAEARLVNQAEIAGGPSTPRTKLMTAFGAVLGLTIGLVAALMMELMGKGFRDATELSQATGLPVLSAIPRVSMRKPHDVVRHLGADHYSLFAERIRQLRTMVATKLTRSGKLGRSARGSSILILSSVPNEGKTTTAIALASSFASSGRKTLLLDLDTRRSEIVDFFAVQHNDLTGWLAAECEIDSAIHFAEKWGMYVAGIKKGAKLIADDMTTASLKRLMDELSARFEIIVVDMPPVLAVSDGFKLATFVDHILYVVAFGKTPRKAVNEGLSSLASLDIRPEGLVLTKAELASESYSYGKRYKY